MLSAVVLSNIMESEKELIEEIIAVIKNERKAIIEVQSAQLQLCLQELDTLKTKLNEAEKQRMLLVGGKSLQELLPGFTPEEQEKLARLKLELKSGMREVKALRHANGLLFQQSGVMLAAMQDKIRSTLGWSYNRQGAVAKKSSPSGNFMYNLA